jgi:hypothetical protein
MATTYIDNSSISDNLQNFLEMPLPMEYVRLIAGYNNIHLGVGIKRDQYSSYTKTVRCVANELETHIKGSIIVAPKAVPGKENEMAAALQAHQDTLLCIFIGKYIAEHLDDMVSEYKKDKTGRVANEAMWMMRWFAFITLARRYDVIPQDLNNGWAQQKGKIISMKADGEEVIISAPLETNEMDTFITGLMNKVKRGGKKA